MTGLWAYSQTGTDADGRIHCTDVGQLDLTQTGTSVTGRITGRGGCEGPGGAFDYVVTGALSLGRVGGDTIVFQAGSCRYAGALGADHVAGTTNCEDHHTAATILLQGNWQMDRVTR